MTLPTRLIASLAILLALGAGAFAARPAVAQETVVIPVGDFWFCNSKFEGSECVTTIQVGDTVTWDFTGVTNTHTTTACTEYCNWDSGNMNGGTFSFTFDTPLDSQGGYLYRCSIHPTQMMGRIEVLPTEEEPTATAPTAVVDLVAPATPTPPVAGPPNVGSGPSGRSSGGWWVVAGALAAGLGLTTLGAGYAAMRRRED